MKPKKTAPKGRIDQAKITLSPLKFEDAVRATLSTGKAPPAPKPKPKGKK